MNMYLHISSGAETALCINGALDINRNEFSVMHAHAYNMFYNTFLQRGFNMGLITYIGCYGNKNL